jgi:hypothetical protein
MVRILSVGLQEGASKLCAPDLLRGLIRTRALLPDLVGGLGEGGERDAVLARHLRLGHLVHVLV